MSNKAFLTAEWRNLILANYAIPKELLQPYLPPGIELDEFQGQYWGSLVGFQFLNTRVLGISWPGFRHFPEWNLRFYVRCGDQRGVCFVREFVPQWLIATVARVIYNEPYRSAPMTMDIQESESLLTADYTLRWNGLHRLKATGRKPALRPGSDTLEHWFKEHSWGFGVTHFGKTLRYEVNHPEWDVYPVDDFHSEVDWAMLYGKQWEQMNNVKPASVVLAVGSAVSVYPKGTL
jgi:uncharacterized protein